jgi:hypothetical protein
MHAIAIRNVFLVWVLGLILSVSPSINAHPADSSIAHLIYHADAIELRIELPDYELKMAAPQLSRWDIVPNDALLDYVHPRLSVTTNQGKPLTLNVLPITSRMDEDGNRDRIYQLRFSADTTPTDWPLTLNYDGITHRVMNHKTYVWLMQDFDQAIFADYPTLVDVIRYQHTTVTLEHSPSSLRGLSTLSIMGAHHILNGLDHLAFLVGLLWLCVKRASHQEASRPLWLESISIITAFSLGHSISLAATVLGMVSLPVNWIEIAVAATLIVTGGSLLIKQQRIALKFECFLALFFGVIHGMAFSEVFTEMSLKGAQLIAALLSFNLGIEAIQIIIACIALPLIKATVRLSAFDGLSKVTGMLILLSGLMWLIERALGWTLPIEAFATATPLFWILEYLALMAVLALWLRYYAKQRVTENPTS